MGKGLLWEPGSAEGACAIAMVSCGSGGTGHCGGDCHDADHRWCLDCHDNAKRDVLHLSSGDPVPFTESYRLCGQCHGDKYRDWRAGVHGKRIGHWDGEKTYFLCVNCHNPHAPRFKGVVEIEVAG